MSFAAHDLSPSGKPDLGGQIYLGSSNDQDLWDGRAVPGLWVESWKMLSAVLALFMTHTDNFRWSEELKSLFYGLCQGTLWLCYHDPIHNLMPSLNRRDYLGLVVRFLFSFFTREYVQKRKAALQTQSANQMQKMGIRAGFSSKPEYCLILYC